MATASLLPRLVADLPEVYQPVFGHPELSTAVSRGCDHRFQTIAAVYDALAAALERPLRVLDLGCAQGWFSLSLAARGAGVRGVDWNAANAAVCAALAGEHPEWNVRFERGDIAAVIPRLRAGEFDLVLGLSVFHHLCEKHGQPRVRGLLTQLLGQVPNALLELALAGEPPAWSRALPDHPDALLEGMPFFRVLSRHPTHLSPLDRPLYFCSREFWLLDRLQRFQRWSGGEGRRLLAGAEESAKVYADTPANARALDLEARFLSEAGEGLWLPRLLRRGQAQGRIWLVTTNLPGGNLAELIAVQVPFNAGAVLRQVLRQLAAWERFELFHLDLRAGDVVAAEDGGIGIAASTSLATGRTEMPWPQQPFVSFWLLVYELLHRTTVGRQPARPDFLRPENLPAPYSAWSKAFWDTPAEQWNFATLLQGFPH